MRFLSEGSSSKSSAAANFFADGLTARRGRVEVL
jgi:hypothetical protein